MKIKIPFNNIAERSAILAYVWAKGYQRRNNLPNTLESVNVTWSERNYNNVTLITLDTKTKIVDGSKDLMITQGREMSLLELFSDGLDRFPRVVEVKLNKEHTAQVYEDSIKVGCQYFPISIIDDLVSARKQFS